MPRGRKRNQTAGNDPLPEKEAKMEESVGEEEIFVDIVETDDGDQFEEAAYQIPDNVVKNPRVSKPRRRLPPPRLVNPNPLPPAPKPSRKQVGGRTGAKTRAQTVHERVLDEMKPPKMDGIEDGEQAETEEHKCTFCEAVLYSAIELLEHQRAFHKEQVKEEDLPNGNLLCAYPHCFASFPDVRHLIAHLVAYHSQQQYRIQKKTFDDIDKFWNWKNEAESTARAKFMGREEPESSSVSADAFEFSNYCEFCDDWREQHEKGPPMPEQVPRKIIGCPAYFTASIDNKKRKASVIGCFAHLGHHKKLGLNALNDSKNKTQNGPSPAGNFANIKCSYCEMMFRSRSAATRHHRMVHRTVLDADGNKRQIASEPKMPSLECADSECTVLCDSMVTLVQHVAEAHKVDVEVNDYTFPNLEKFEAWKTQMEQETCSKFCKVSGRVLPNEITKYFLCHLSGHTNRTKKKEYTPSDRQRNRPTKKMGRYCTAFMSFKQSKSDGSINVRGCLRHFGHPLDVRRLPLPDVVRKEISDLLLKGCNEEDVVGQVRSQYNENERGYWLQRYEVRNIALKLQREGLMIASKTFLASEEDGRLWDEMGFPEDNPYLPQFVQTSSKLVPIHTDRRYVARGTRERLEVLQYVEADEYGDEEAEELVDMEDGEVYYEQIDEDAMQTEDGTRIIPMRSHVVEQHLIAEDMPGPSHGGRKRMPLLKEPMRTGNPAFDDVMTKMKARFNKISQQLKVTQDVRLAHGMLKELKELQQRMGVVSPEDESQLIEAHWNDDEYFEDEEYVIEQGSVGEEVTEEGYEYIDEDNVVVADI